jgi:hypothetical protein
MFDHYYNYHLIVEYISKIQIKSFIIKTNYSLFVSFLFSFDYLPIGNIDSKIGQLFKLFERLSVYPITLA